MKNSSPSHFTTENDIILKKMQRYCTYQDRSHSEVRKKLLSLKVYGDSLEEIISTLLEQGYLNELRYAKSIVTGKFRLKSWGRQKIKNFLKGKKVSAYCIKKALEEIKESEYIDTLENLITKYKSEREYLKIEDVQLNNNCVQYCINKGFEYSLIKKALDN